MFFCLWAVLWIFVICLGHDDDDDEMCVCECVRAWLESFTIHLTYSNSASNYEPFVVLWYQFCVDVAFYQDEVICPSIFSSLTAKRTKSNVTMNAYMKYMCTCWLNLMYFVPLFCYEDDQPVLCLRDEWQLCMCNNYPYLEPEFS